VAGGRTTLTKTTLILEVFLRLPMGLLRGFERFGGMLQSFL
jgi:hypothetical protein